MAKKTKNFKITSGFWKGLILGVVIAVIGIFIYFKFFTPLDKFPPTNINECVCSYPECNAMVHGLPNNCHCGYLYCSKRVNGQ